MVDGVLTDEHPLEPSWTDRVNFIKLLMGFNGFPTDTTSDSEKGTMEIVVRS